MAPREVTLLKATSIIGRDPGCDIVLADADKHISRQHAALEVNGTGATLLVTSRVNPVIVSGKEIGFQQRAPLRNGDTLDIIGFRLTVSFDESTTGAAGGLTHDEDPFAWLDRPKATQLSSATGPDPLSELSSPRVPPRQQPDPFQRAEKPAADLVAGLSAISGLAATPGGLATTQLDPMRLIESPGNRALDSLSGHQTGTSAIDALLGTPPRTPSQGLSSDPLVKLGKIKPTGSSSADHVHDFDLPFQSASPLRDATDDPFADLLPLRSRPPEADGVAAPTHAPPVATQRLPVAPTTSGAAANAACQAFYRGLGIEGMAPAADDAERRMELAGQITHAAIAGILQLLTTRGEMKRELRAADRTMLAATANNPLKMMDTEREAIAFLFDSEQQNAAAFMPPMEAMADACADILAHEFGLIAGLRAAVLGALKHYDPQVLEQRAEKQGRLASLIGNRKAQLWDSFIESYRKTEESAADDVDRLFERDFLRAYTAQVKKMREGR
jgi:FHA domain-containing protein